MARSQQLIRLDFEGAFDHADYSELQASCEVLAKNCDVVILSDYAKGTLKNIELLIQMFRSLDKSIVIDPKGLDFNRYKGATILTPNLSEFEDVVGECNSLDEIQARGLKLCQELDLLSLLVTLGDEGMLFLKPDGEALHLEANTKEVFDVTGAGDTVIATLAVALAKGWSAEEAIAISNVAAGIVVSKTGTATVNPDELARGLQADNHHSLKICDEQEISKLVANAQAQDEIVVMTNGCFDILHNGHVDYLQKAKRLGHRLLVAVNSDESVSSIKGDDRPLNNLYDRMQMLAALECVTWVTSFSQLTPERLIGLVKPDILVKGADYAVSEIAGAASVLEAGGQVKTVELLSGFSTTGLVEKIRNSLIQD
jgi:D-beta-D-heptose 7-phosphate kinase/D-beta-D-heptose 1-phosphate adenosyltransferase